MDEKYPTYFLIDKFPDMFFLCFIFFYEENTHYINNMTALLLSVYFYTVNLLYLFFYVKANVLPLLPFCVPPKAEGKNTLSKSMKDVSPFSKT